MNKKSIFILISFLFFKSISSQDFDCASDFERYKNLACYQLSNSDQYCQLVDNECREWYKKCEDYNPSSNFDEEICKKIVPSTLNKKCSVKTEGGSKTVKWWIKIATIQQILYAQG